MQLTEHRLDKLTQLRFRVFTCTLDDDQEYALVLKCSGKLEPGSAGKQDTEVLRIFTLAAVSYFWAARGLVFDFRELDYQRGNTIWSVFGNSIPSSGIEHLPLAMIISDRCRSGFSTCPGMVPPQFEDLESALQYLAKQRTSPTPKATLVDKRPWWRFWR